MKASPLFSVVIPTYNRKHFIVETIESVLSQTCQNYEILVVDNHSTDGTETLLQSYIKAEQIRFIKHDQNYERACSRNTGMENAKGDFLTFLDSDDFLYPNCLADAAAFIVKNPEIKCFHSLYELLNVDKELIYQYQFPPIIDQIDAIANGNFMACIGDFIHRDIYTRYRFDTFQPLTGAEDWEFWLRVLADHKLGRIEEVNCGIQHHGGRSISAHNISELESGYLYFFKKFRDDPHLSLVYAKYLNRIEASSYLYLAILSNTAGLFSDSFRFINLARRADRTVVFTKRFAKLLTRRVLRLKIS